MTMVTPATARTAVDARNVAVSSARQEVQAVGSEDQLADLAEAAVAMQLPTAVEVPEQNSVRGSACRNRCRRAATIRGHGQFRSPPFPFAQFGAVLDVPQPNRFIFASGQGTAAAGEESNPGDVI